jgi:hypothetical protein
LKDGGDFSKSIKEQELKKNYRKVLSQQGRVLTDADWNEQINIQDSHDKTSLRDIIGKNGIPIEEKDSFKITPKAGNTFTIGKGRIYVDGRLVENFEEVGNYAFSNGADNKVNGQPFLPSLIIEDQQRSEAIPREPGLYLAYLRVFDRHITYLEDPDIKESALGDSDTTTRSQLVWQVLLHRLEDGEPVNENEPEDSKWIPMKHLGTEVGGFIKVGSNKDSNLEVFVIGPPNNTFRSKRQISSNPDNWEDDWTTDPANLTIDRIEVASNRDGLLELFGISIDPIENITILSQNSKLEDSNWSGWKPIAFHVKEMAIGSNKDGSLELFYISRVTNNWIYHSKQKSTRSDWEAPKLIAPLGALRLAVITNPTNDCIELYAIEETGGNVFFTRQTEPNSSEWLGWTEINPNRAPLFFELAVGINRNNKPIIFVSDTGREIWSTIRSEPDSPQGNGWTRVGSKSPGKLIVNSPLQGVMSVQNHVKKRNRLELFAIFSPVEASEGSIWTIAENDDGLWSSEWTPIEESSSSFVEISSRTDGLSRLNIFGRLKVQRNLVPPIHHILYTYFEDKLGADMCMSDIPSWDSKIKPSNWELAARTRPHAPQTDDPCQLPEQAGYRRLENQLYRIEIHESKSGEKKATFKYSRDNGTVCTAVTNISGNKISVASLGKDKLLGFSIGQWVEIEDERRILWGMCGVLVHVSDIDGNNLIYDRKIPTDAVINNNAFPQDFNPKVRRWDSPRGTLNVEIPTSNNGWIEIEDGIEVKFNNIDNTGDVCRTGDYCTFPARTLRADIEWPKGADGLPKFVNSEGIEYHYAKLAFLEYTGEELKLISDCRDFFPSLTSFGDLSQPHSTETIIVKSWVHGTSSEVEFPVLLADPSPPPGPGTKHGRGSLYRQIGEKTFPYNWFHFPLTISHPIDSAKKMILQKVYILFECKNAKIIDIDVYDGKKILDTWGPNVSGSHDEEPDNDNTFILKKPAEVLHSIGISVQVEFPIKKPGEISFRAVGVELRIG